MTTTTIAEDPSLYRPLSLQSTAYVTMTEDVAPTVLDHGGVEITWDDTTEEFTVIINGLEITDLVTGTTDGFPSFEGKFTGGGDPTVYGYVEPGASAESYTVYLTIPNNKPLRFKVSNSTGYDPVVDEYVACDCSNNIDLGCVNNDCRNGNSCPNDTEYDCEWESPSA